MTFSGYLPATFIDNNRYKKTGCKAGFFIAANNNYMFSIITSPNSEQDISVASLIKRSKS